MKKILPYIYAILTIYSAFSAGLWYMDKNYIMMSICLIGSVCWYGCNYLDGKWK